jgi:hypothetical protein
MIYFIQEESKNVGNIKIGYTDGERSLHQRIKHHQCGNPRALNLIGTMEGNIKLEMQFHSMFSHINIRGEWYKPNINLLYLILGMCDWCESKEIFRQIELLRYTEHMEVRKEKEEKETLE